MALNQGNTQGWEVLVKGITKVKNILEGLPEPQISWDDFQMVCTTVNKMCTQKPDNSQQLYDEYKKSFDEYITSMVLPSLKQKTDESMLRELVKRWENNKLMVKWLTRFFCYLDCYFIRWRSLPALRKVGFTCFKDLVYREIKAKVRDDVISLIDQEREGEQIDRTLLKNLLEIFVEIGMGSMDCYKMDFEEAMLNGSAVYYYQKASNWILEDGFADYHLKVEECLKSEKDRVSHYLHHSTEQKLLEKVQDELKLVCSDNAFLRDEVSRVIVMVAIKGNQHSYGALENVLDHFPFLFDQTLKLVVVHVIPLAHGVAVPVDPKLSCYKEQKAILKERATKVMYKAKTICRGKPGTVPKVDINDVLFLTLEGNRKEIVPKAVRRYKAKFFVIGRSRKNRRETFMRHCIKTAAGCEVLVL